MPLPRLPATVAPKLAVDLEFGRFKKLFVPVMGQLVVIWVLAARSESTNCLGCGPRTLFALDKRYPPGSSQNQPRQAINVHCRAGVVQKRTSWPAARGLAHLGELEMAIAAAFLKYVGQLPQDPV